MRRQIQIVLNEIQFLTRMLYSLADHPARSLVLQEFWNQTSFLQFLMSLVDQQLAAPPVPAAVAAIPVMPQPAVAAAPALARPAAVPRPPVPSPIPPAALPTFTRDQLAAFTGRNGNPAYVAVGGTVYDVTDAAGWSLATHFGLTAGRDLTAEFTSCHGAQQYILSLLRPVGRLA